MVQGNREIKPIGGYPALELRKGSHYHEGALRLNTARNCLEYILRVRNYRKVYVPYYTCEVVVEPLAKLGIPYEFYHIDRNLDPVRLPKLADGEALLYTNYFGLKGACTVKLAEHYGSKLIIDNAQAFYAPRIAGIDTFYSARKFFGVADGAYLYTDLRLKETLAKDYSYARMSHLLKRIDLSPEAGYDDFHRAEQQLVNAPILQMSAITESILQSIDYNYDIYQRRKNFMAYQEAIGLTNGIDLQLDEDSAPMAYPYLTSDPMLRQQLISQKIYVPFYWPNVSEWADGDSLETTLAAHLQALPVAHLTEDDLQRVISNINNHR